MHNDGDNGFVFPYKAKSPATLKVKEFNTIDDVYNELIVCYDKLREEGSTFYSDALYSEHFFFCNTNELLDRKVQERVVEYNFCKAFNCPPYPSLKETPAKVIDDFMEIENIMNSIKKENNNVS